MIVEQAVTNDVLDMGLLQQTAEPARQILEVETIDVVADKGYFKTSNSPAAARVGMNGCCDIGGGATAADSERSARLTGARRRKPSSYAVSSYHFHLRVT
jgi:hypothetical protein